MQKFSIQELESFRAAFDEAMKQVAEKTGVVVTLGRISYERDKPVFRGSIEGAKTVKGVPPEFAADYLHWQDHCEWYGLEPQDWGVEITIAGKVYKVIAINANKPKFRFGCIEVATGKRVSVAESAKVLIQTAAKARRIAEGK